MRNVGTPRVACLILLRRGSPFLAECVHQRKDREPDTESNSAPSIAEMTLGSKGASEFTKFDASTANSNYYVGKDRGEHGIMCSAVESKSRRPPSNRRQR